MRPINRFYEKKITKLELYYYDNWWWDYYNDYYNNHNYDDDDYWRYYDYSYDNSRSANLHLLMDKTYDPNGEMPKFFMHRAIDLNSFYTKEELRERKLNDLLGLPNGTFKLKKNLLEDLIKKDVKNNSPLYKGIKR